MQPLTLFLDVAVDMIFNWSKDHITACAGLYPNPHQLKGLSSAHAADFYCNEGTWVRRRRVDDVCTPITESEGKRVIALFGTVKVMDVIDKY